MRRTFPEIQSSRSISVLLLEQVRTRVGRRLGWGGDKKLPLGSLWRAAFGESAFGGIWKSSSNPSYWLRGRGALFVAYTRWNWHLACQDITGEDTKLLQVTMIRQNKGLCPKHIEIRSARYTIPSEFDRKAKFCWICTFPQNYFFEPSFRWVLNWESFSTCPILMQNAAEKKKNFWGLHLPWNLYMTESYIL